MRKIAIAALAVLAAVLLSACASTGEALPYENAAHTHVYGRWYDVSAVTCLDAGEQIRYCKVCRASQQQVLEVESAIEDRKHAFFDTVTPPTEKDGGYTTRECSLCQYKLEGLSPTLPLYALYEDENTLTDALQGAQGLLLASRASQHISWVTGREMAVNAAFAGRVCAALLLTDAFAGGVLTPETAVSVTQEMLASVPEGAARTEEVFFSGASLTAGQVLGLWIESGGGDAAVVLAALLGLEIGDLPAAMTARAADLGLNGTSFSSFFEGKSTLGDTAVLLGRALAQEEIATALRNTASPYIKIMGESPVVWFSTVGLRVSAIEREGKVFFLVLAGEALGGGLESTVFEKVLAP